MQNNENKKRRFSGKGYYIALIACLAAVGISGYVFTTTVRNSAVETSAPVTISPAETNAPDTSAAPSTAPSAKASSAFDEETAAEEGDSYEETMAVSADPVWPLEGDVLATFSQDTLTFSQTMQDWRTHEGLDIAAAAGDAVSATESGTVTAIYEDEYLGSVVVVSHEDDVSTLYANLTDTPTVTVGQTVAAGEVIGHVGSTALLEIAEPEHLHFEVFSEGHAVDPLSYLSGD